MKANSTKRKIFDAVDLLTEDVSVQVPVKTMKGGVMMLDIDSIKLFHNHPFHLYEGDRLDDMVESIRDHGILNPVIVRKMDDGYEMLSGHNRQNAAKIAGLKKIPAIIKYDLPDTDAYVYVIETNLMQRSFSDLEISEKAAVLKERYDKVLYQRQRESIMAEVAKLEGKPLKGGHGDHHFNNRDEVGKEYGLSGSYVGRLLKVNDLIVPLRHKLDNGSLMFKVGIQISFLTEEEQQLVYEQMMELHVKLTMAMSIKLREHSGDLNLAMVRRYLTKTVEHKDRPMNIKVSEKISKKYFKGKDQKTIDDILEKALAAWFAAEGGQMFNQEHLSQIDKKYFNVIMLDGKDVTIQSRNTGHYWYLHCTEYPQDESLVLFHKHRFQHPYHQHGRANTLKQAVKSIQEHDKWQMGINTLN